MDGKERGYDCWAKQDFMEGELEIGMGLERGSECPNGIDIQQKNCEGFREGEKESTNNWGGMVSRLCDRYQLFRERFIKTYEKEFI